MTPELEAAICDKLSPLRDAGIEVRPLPDVPAEYGKQRGTEDFGLNGEVIVRFMGDNPSAPSAKFPIVQTNEIDLLLEIRLRQIRGDSATACWAVLSAIRRLLIGFQPEGSAAPIYAAPQGHKYEGRDEKFFWIWTSAYKIPGFFRSSGDEDEALPLLKRITYLFSLDDESLGLEESEVVE